MQSSSLPLGPEHAELLKDYARSHYAASYGARFYEAPAKRELRGGHRPADAPRIPPELARSLARASGDKGALELERERDREGRKSEILDPHGDGEAEGGWDTEESGGEEEGNWEWDAEGAKARGYVAADAHEAGGRDEAADGIAQWLAGARGHPVGRLDIGRDEELLDKIVSRVLSVRAEGVAADMDSTFRTFYLQGLWGAVLRASNGVFLAGLAAAPSGEAE
jgi:hypothetical protein